MLYKRMLVTVCQELVHGNIRCEVIADSKKRKKTKMRAFQPLNLHMKKEKDLIDIRLWYYIYIYIYSYTSIARVCLSVGAASSCRSIAIAIADRSTTDCLSVISKIPDRITSSSAFGATDNDKYNTEERESTKLRKPQIFTPYAAMLCSDERSFSHEK